MGNLNKMNVTFGIIHGKKEVKVSYFSTNNHRAKCDPDVIRISRYIDGHSEEIVDLVNGMRYIELLTLCNDNILQMQNDCFTDYHKSEYDELNTPPYEYRHWVSIKTMIEENTMSHTYEQIFKVIGGYSNYIDWNNNIAYVDDNISGLWKKRNMSWEIASWILCCVIEKNQWKNVKVTLSNHRMYSYLLTNNIITTNPLYISRVRYDMLISLYDGGCKITFNYTNNPTYRTISMFTPNEKLIHSLMVKNY